MSPVEESAFWLEAIATNFGCELPCWLGLEPGIATLVDFSRVPNRAGYATLGMPPPSTTLRSLDIVVTIRPDVEVSPGVHAPQPLSLTVFERNGVIEGFDIHTFALHGPASEALYFPPLEDAMESYSLQAVLQRLGAPDRVLIAPEGGLGDPGAGWHYGIWLYYSDRSTAIYYEGEGISRVGNTITLCPRYEEMGTIDLYLRRAGSPLSLEEATRGSALIAQQLEDGTLVPLQEATGLSHQQFAETFGEIGSQACLEIVVQ